MGGVKDLKVEGKGKRVSNTQRKSNTVGKSPIINPKAKKVSHQARPD